ncbi:MAG: carbohydrate binding domain-containing protein [Kineosporiaceae bacterium]
MPRLRPAPLPALVLAAACALGALVAVPAADAVPDATASPAALRDGAAPAAKATAKCRTKKNGTKVCKTVTKKRSTTKPPSPTPSESGPRPVYEAGFEAGSTDGWAPRAQETVAVTSTAAHTGSRSLLTSGRTSAWHGPSKDLTSLLVPAAGYTVSAYARLVAGTPATTVLLTSAQTSAGTTTYRPVASPVAVTDQQWVRLTGTLSAPSGVDAVALYAESPSATAAFLLDDVTVTPDGTTQSPTPTPTTTSPLPSSTTPSPTLTLGPADLTVDPATRYQKIDGFGAALPIWPGSANGMLSTSEVRTLVGTGESELGLSIIRTMLSHDQAAWPFAVADLKEAKAYGQGVKILASPWTAPASYKTNNSLTGGGKLKTDYYDDYADHLNRYVQYMRGQGVTIDVTSVQNEPDWHPDYDSMDWSGEELRTFVRDVGARVKDTKLMVAESLNMNRALTDPTLNDAAAAATIGYIGGHLYGAEAAGRLSPYPLAAQRSKPVWMTEYNLHEADGSGSAIWGDPSNRAAWDETLDKIMNGVHKSMDSNWSAYVWWYGRRYYSFIGDGESAYGTTKGAVLKRGWAFSQYSRYVRPGYDRVALSRSSKAQGLDVTAYTGDGKVTLVILNRSTSPVTDAVVQVPGSVRAAQYTLTSQYSSRAAQPVAVAGGKVRLTVGPRSISTLVLTTS